MKQLNPVLISDDKTLEITLISRAIARPAEGVFSKLEVSSLVQVLMKTTAQIVSV